MSLDRRYIQVAVNNKRELAVHGISPADFYSIINYDNVHSLLDKVEELKKEVEYLRSEVRSLKYK
jgi:hypothetical protein